MRRFRAARARRAGLATLEVVMTAGVCVPASAALYLLYERVMNDYFFMLGNVVGNPIF